MTSGEGFDLMIIQDIDHEWVRELMQTIQLIW